MTAGSQRNRFSPAEVRIPIAFVLPEVVALLVGHHGDADLDGHGKENQYEDTAAQGNCNSRVPVLLPTVIRGRCVIPSELIAFAINNENHAN
jgi:hypothetical protein